MSSLGPRLQQPLAFWLWLSLACLSASGEGGPYVAAGLLSLGICAILCSVSVPGVPIEPFVRKVFFCVSLWRSHGLGCCLTLAPSDCPQGPGPYPKDQLCSLRLPAQPPLTGGGPECLGHFSTGSCA